MHWKGLRSRTNSGKIGFVLVIRDSFVWGSNLEVWIERIIEIITSTVLKAESVTCTETSHSQKKQTLEMHSQMHD